MYEKYQNFYLKTLFLVVKFSIYLNRRVFVMVSIFILTLTYDKLLPMIN